MAKPLILTKENVLAAMKGRKTMTRRIINPQPEVFDRTGRPAYACLKPKYQVGDEVYVAEAYQIDRCGRFCDLHGHYLADHAKFKVSLDEWSLWKKRKFPYRPTPGRFMYKSLARSFMRITEVKVERLQDITFSDVLAEGIVTRPNWKQDMSKWERGEIEITFASLWNSIHGAGAWEKNPWVFCYRWELI